MGWTPVRLFRGRSRPPPPRCRPALRENFLQRLHGIGGCRPARPQRQIPHARRARPPWCVDRAGEEGGWRMNRLALADLLLRDAAALVVVKATIVLALASAAAFAAKGFSAARRHMVWLVALSSCVWLVLTL